MLRALTIRHFAIIDALELEFQAGFTVISGETGAGKSILIDALGLLLGDRANAGQVAAGRPQADLSAEFDLGGQAEALAWLQDQALEEDQQLLIRRVISAEGGSRAWINGRSATVGQLAELGEHLVEIHGQHEHQLLNQARVQRALLDRLVEPEALATLGSRFEAWQQAQSELDQFERDCGDPAQLELLRFQQRELDALALAPGEFQQLEQEQERLASSDEIRAGIARAQAALDDDNGPSASSLLLEAATALERISTLDPGLAEVAKLLAEARINLDEALSSLERAADEDSHDPERLESINRRLEKALDLARKHRIRPEDLPQLNQDLSSRLEKLEHQDERREGLMKGLQQARDAWQRAADEVSKLRSAAALDLAHGVTARLAELGMDQARFSVEVAADSNAEPSRHGQDRIRLLFSANPGQPAQALHRVASGGELSRISLALMIATRSQATVPARVFDEVDAGIGGETAHVVGRFLREVATGAQAFCVTHLAQVAARADHHFRVVKASSGDVTRIRIEALDQKAREEELARMLGSRSSASSLAHARELLAS